MRHEDIQLSDYKRKWNFIVQMLPQLPAELTHGKKDLYLGWWVKNKVHTPGVIPPAHGAAYVHAYARDGRMDAAFDYCRRSLDDMEFNEAHLKSKLRNAPPGRGRAVRDSQHWERHSVPTSNR